MERDGHVKQAGGFIIQVMPFADDAVIDTLEASLTEIHSVTDMLDQGMSPEELLQQMLGELDLEVSDRIPAEYYCNCSRERVSSAIASIGRKDLQEMIAEQEPIEVNCQFCGSHYIFETEDLKQMMRTL